LYKDEVISHLKIAVEALEKALEEYSRKGLQAANRSIWIASSESEYALFLLSVSSESNDLPITEEKNHTSRLFKPHNHMAKARALLQDALESYGSEEDLKKLYPKVWESRGYLIELQEKMGKASL
jgi:hypothetical protein